MMQSVICKQQKALKGKIITTVILLVSILMLFKTTEPFLSRLLFFVIAVIVFGFSVSFKITQSFKNRKIYQVFGIPIFSVDLDLIYPDYISVSSGLYSLDNEWGTVSSLGTKERHDKTSVRFFKDNRNEIVFLSDKYQESFRKAKELSQLLEVELYDATKR